MKKTSTSKKCFKSAKNSEMRKKQFKMKTNIGLLRRNLRTIIESFEKQSLKGPKNCKFGEICRTWKNYEKNENNVLKKVDKTLKTSLEVCRSPQIGNQKMPNFTEDRKIFYTKTLKKSVKRLKTVIGKTKWAPQDRQRSLTKRERKQYSDKKKFRRVKRV